MSISYPIGRRFGWALFTALLLVGIAVSSALAGGPPAGAASGEEEALEAPALTIKPVVAPRRSPPPIPHSSVLDPETIENFIQSEGLRPQSEEAADAAEAQDVAGEPGVLQTVTSIANGITLFEPENVCNDFDRNSRWEGEVWTSYYSGWGPFAADDGYFQAKNVTFDRERVVGPGSEYGSSHASMKIASNQPYDAGVMSPAIDVDPGDTVRVRVAYLIYNHDTEGRNWDYASMGIIPKLGETASYVQGYHRGEWAILEQEIVATGDQVVVMLQGHSPAAINSNIYFDNVEIYVNGRAKSNCQ